MGYKVHDKEKVVEHDYVGRTHRPYEEHVELLHEYAHPAYAAPIGHEVVHEVVHQPAPVPHVVERHEYNPGVHKFYPHGLAGGYYTTPVAPTAVHQDTYYEYKPVEEHYAMHTPIPSNLSMEDPWAHHYTMNASPEDMYYNML